MLNEMKGVREIDEVHSERICALIYMNVEVPEHEDSVKADNGSKKVTKVSQEGSVFALGMVDKDAE